jgi:hypothetical protein
MIPRFLRAIAAPGLCSLIAACAGAPAVVPGAHSASEFAVLFATRHQAAKCTIQSGWTFIGPCHDITLGAYHGTTVRFPVYRRLRVTARFGTVSLKAGAPLDVALGTSDSDITGTFVGTPFPEYGTSGGCWGSPGRATPCRGQAFLYFLLLATNTSIGFNDTPFFSITDAATFPGAKCEEAMLTYTGSTKAGTFKWIWAEMHIYAKPRNGALKFKTSPWGLNIPAAGFEVIAFHCY